MTLYLRLGAYLAAVLLCVGIGWHLGSLGPKRDLAALQAQDWEAKAQATQVALSAVQAQLKQEQTTSANNSTVIQGLQNDNAKITAGWASDRTLVQRLLNNASRPSSGGVVPKAPSGQATPTASPNPGDGSTASLFANAAIECQRNADQLNALIAEIAPQL